MKNKTDFPRLSLKRLAVRLIEAEETERFNQLLKDHHYLHSSRSAGETLRYVGEIEGEWVALVMWGAPAYRLKDRDGWIGWDHAQRHARLKLVVQNRRFLILPGVKLENLASKVLGACTRQLPQDWREHFGYEPVLAETFVDPQIYRGTCYRAAGWEALGMSAGFGRVREDFYEEHERPKQLWVKCLHKDARRLLSTTEALPAAQQAGLNAKDNSHATALGVPQMEGLWKRYQNRLHDSRKRGGLRYHLATVLGMVVLGVLSGKSNLAEIVEFCRHLSQSQLRALRSWRHPRTGRFHAPSYNVFYRVLNMVDAEAFDQIMTEFICEQDGLLPRDIGIDGKTLKGTGTGERKALHLVSAFDNETAETLAQVATQEKSNEITAARELLNKMPPMPGSTFTFDALHAQSETLQQLVSEKGADYIVQIKDNQPSVASYAKALFGPSPFLSMNKPTGPTG